MDDNLNKFRKNFEKFRAKKFIRMIYRIEKC